MDATTSVTLILLFFDFIANIAEDCDGCVEILEFNGVEMLIKKIQAVSHFDSKEKHDNCQGYIVETAIRAVALLVLVGEDAQRRIEQLEGTGL